MTAPADDEVRSTILRVLPGVAVVEALDRLGESGGADVGALRAALERIVEAVGAGGVRLSVEASPLPVVEVGVGTLAGTAGSGPPDEGRDPGSPVTVVDLTATVTGRRLGRLVVDAPADVMAATVRAVELAVQAAWFRIALRATTRRLVALDAATRAITAELDVDRVLQLIVDQVRELIGARYAALGIDDGHGGLERFITVGITPEERAAIGPPPRGHGLLGYIIREGRSLTVPDMSVHPDRVGFPPNHPPMTSLLGVPITVDGRPIGDFYLTDKERGEPFTDEDRETVELFALHAGIAIDNARLHEQVGRLAVVDERERIARDLHDGIIQSIYAVGLSLEHALESVHAEPDAAAERVDRAIDGLNVVIADLREYIIGLRPGLAREDDVVTGLARAAEALRLNSTTDLEISLEGGVRAARRLSPDRAAALLSIAREALSNIARHAAAARGWLVLRDEAGSVVLEVADDGRGFSVGATVAPDERGLHQGLLNMRDRATGMGGTFSVDSAPGEGTRIIVTLPVQVPASPVPSGSAVLPAPTGESPP